MGPLPGGALTGPRSIRRCHMERHGIACSRVRRTEPPSGSRPIRVTIAAACALRALLPIRSRPD